MTRHLSSLGSPLGAQLDAELGDWAPLLQAWRGSDAGQATLAAVDARVAGGAVVYPAQVFRALALTPLAATRVVILGQDPYHGAGQAEGLAFSVPPGQKVPPSLRNIFKELQRDLGLLAPAHGSLLAWAAQGVLLLNTTLTVEEARPGAHAKLGWQVLTDAICQALLADPAPKVFLLWGAHAQGRLPLGHQKAQMAARASERPQADDKRRPPSKVDEQSQQVRLAQETADTLLGPHRVLRCNHPSPLAALRPPLPFIGCGHFGLANQYLSSRGRGAVSWQLT